MNTQDEAQRSEALNPSKSFIVQAPAGSGKTELLTQRFLVLLSTVKQPEEILAITFTKKSAAEMRARIINALQNALINQEPQIPHTRKTWHLAKKVLQQDKKLKWNLLTSPNRLKLQTIDSFNASLTRQLPILSNFGATPDITNDPYALYRQAVQEFLTHLEENHAWSNAIATILLHMDNDLNKVEALLINLLAKRDQWLRHITVNSQDDFLRHKLEEHLGTIVTETLEKLSQQIPQSLTDELLFILRYAAHNALCNQSESSLITCTNLIKLPSVSLDSLQHWLGIRELLFTKNDEWRKKLDINIGFPPATFFTNSAEKNLAIDIKSRANQLIKKLANYPQLQETFKNLKNSPETIYQEDQWQTLAALHLVLQVLAAQLKVVFQRHGKIDYIENALAAIHALGTDDAPTDLTLTLDYQLKHILIDEFQDTSNSQYQLLKKITAGWDSHDGRTLFLVGDPMQSIYRFREAEVGIFIRARKHGIGLIKLEPLTLSVNFRSTPGIVDWVNEQFPQVFPVLDDIGTGAVSYSPSLTNQEKQNDITAVSLHALMNAEDTEQANTIVALIRTRQATNPNDTIAILVRSRTHLRGIIPALKAAGLIYRAINIDPLTARPFIQDLMSLTRAMTNPADRIAWLTILRAPWCGLSLADLLYLSGQDSKVSLWERLQSIEVIATLSIDGQQRLNRILPILKLKIPERQRYPLRAWIESTWLLLGGPACVNHTTDLEDVTAYFKLLNDLDQRSHFFNFDLLDEYVNQLYAAPNSHADDKLQIMTIHNAKGLEFDTVILPHLERKSSNDDKQLLLWMERPRDDEKNALIIAPVHAIGKETDSIYEYIKREHAIKNDFERSRLLYVAVTRAKKHLELFFTLKDDRKINSNSLLEKLWPSIKNKIVINEQKHGIAQSGLDQPSVYLPQKLRRLTLDWHNPIKEDRLIETIAYHQKKMGFLLPNNLPKQLGTVTHQVLQQISQLGAYWWQKQLVKTRHNYLNYQLTQLGVSLQNARALAEKIYHAIDITLADPRGQWILSPHQEAQSEFTMTALINTETKQLIIDRTFIDKNNIRWIIDYKTSTIKDNENLAEFLQNEQKNYQKKMWYYHQAIKEIDSRPIRMGLYFPFIPAWHEWSFENNMENT